jgi:hypothetical protein
VLDALPGMLNAATDLVWRKGMRKVKLTFITMVAALLGRASDHAMTAP